MHDKDRKYFLCSVAQNARRMKKKGKRREKTTPKASGC
jgi:hypothetical protein